MDKPGAVWSAIILAAGESSRFGRCKQLLRFRGRSLLEHAIATVQGQGPKELVVVLGAQAERLAPLVTAAGARAVVNEHWRDGMGASLASGALALAPGHGVLVMLADQPLVEIADIGNLLAAWQKCPQSPAAASSRDYLGPPVLFPAANLDRLRQLSGHHGARHLLQGRHVSAVAMDGAPIDIDSPEDLALLAHNGVHLE